MGNRVVSFLLFFVLYNGIVYYGYYNNIRISLTNHVIDSINFYSIIGVLVAHSIFFGYAGISFYEFIWRNFKLKKQKKIIIFNKEILFLLQGIIITFACSTIFMALDHNPQNEFYYNPVSLFMISGSWFVGCNLILIFTYAFIKFIRISFKK